MIILFINHLDSDEVLNSSSNQNITNLTGAPSPTPAQTSPRSAVRSIISSYLQNSNSPAQPPPPPVKLHSRVRVERKFGEDITNGNLLQELKEKAEAKKLKEMKKKVAQAPQRSSRKKN